MNVGIDIAAMATGHYALDLRFLAVARSVDPRKYTTGLGQDFMSVASPQEDVVTMGVEAGLRALEHVSDPTTIRLVLFATESSVDQSKSAGIYIHHFLGLNPSCRVVELKQACYSATAALHIATAFVRQNPAAQALIIASDIARYGLNTSGEPTQGCGAVALVVSANPRVLVVETTTGVYTRHIMDFWRPNGQDAACVNGRYSALAYLEALSKTWADFQCNGGGSVGQIDFMCYHTPFTKMAEKAFARHTEIARSIQRGGQYLPAFLPSAVLYGRRLGNCYTASLYISLLSLLENTAQDLAGARVGLFSYGSGCVAEFFTGVLAPGYQNVLFAEAHTAAIAQRALLTVSEYEAFYTQSRDPVCVPEVRYYTGPLCFLGVKDHQRHYRLTLCNTESCTQVRLVS
ncbi:MAG: hydroxymethylglutaryl-CoA synthase [Holosporales bacterium]|jgi:hydroxymethylglutaryl-CoA synthase|nr:hydroxymethylglutaryl-CoA synthase [Holosporales bacterium]